MEKPTTPESKRPNLQPFAGLPQYSADQTVNRSKEFLCQMRTRRTLRDFSDRPVPRPAIEACLQAAGTAPSGANQQPWHFAVVQDRAVKTKIRIAAEQEERRFYQERAPKQWLDALAPLGVDEHKPFLEIAPYLIVIFRRSFELAAGGAKVKQYYSSESVGIATGMLITALHHCGLATLTHTPSPMGFLNEILKRPKEEKPFLLLVVGYPAADAKVPVITKKTLSEIATFF
ncbi:MAG: nitroreductase family protein [Pirellulales bacterium]|nr:nitroreductase family protein [Pirellulales bacterium]